MKCLKVDDYVKRTACPKDTSLLLEEVQNFVKSGPGPQGRTLCDRVIRACNQRLGDGPPGGDHVGLLMMLVEVALRGYDVSGEPVQTSPLYMEKILFHVVKKLSSLGEHRLSSHLGGLLHRRLAPAQQTEGYCVLVQNCFAVLWSGLSATAKGGTVLKTRDKLHCKMTALNFLLLLERESTAPVSCSKVPVYTEDALNEFVESSGTLTKDDASFLLKETELLFGTCWIGGRGGGEDGRSSEQRCVPTLSEVALVVAKVLCQAAYWDLAAGLVGEVQSQVGERVGHRSPALALGGRAVDIHRSVSSGEASGQAFTECARALRALPADLGDWEAHAVLEGCDLVVWAVDAAPNRGFSGPVLLAWFSFLEEHQELILRRLQKSEDGRLQECLCSSMYQGLGLAYKSMLASQLGSSETLDRVLLYCQATAGRMMTELRKLSSDNLLIKTVIAVVNLGCGLFNRQLYDQAFTLVLIICQELRKNCPASLSVERLNRAFMLVVQSSRHAGQLERALDWVIVWLKALGEQVTTQRAEPISLWVKAKADAAHSGEEDIRLRTLRDGFGADLPEEEVLLSLLDEELHGYKKVSGDTTQERYNTLCDLLDICHEESPRTHLRAVYLCEMAQIVCFQDFSEQTDCSAVDFTHEALRLLEEEPETAENADQLKDDQARTLIWLYICTVEKNLQEAMDKEKKLQDLREQTQGVADPVGTNDLDYEDKQKQQDSSLVYEGLCFNLAAESKLCEPLDKALRLLTSLLQSPDLPSVRNPKHTCSSLVLAAALYKLMGKPLLALEAYQLAHGLCSRLANATAVPPSLCNSARILLELGAPELAWCQLEQAEQFLTSDTSAEGPLHLWTVLLKAQYCYSTGQVARGVPYLCEVLKEVNEQRKSLTWYLLTARALQTCSSYLSLDTDALPQALRLRITQHGLSSPDTTLYEALKLLCSLLVTLVGRGLYGTCSSSSDRRFIDQGGNVVMKWQLLSELLGCSVKMVSVRRSSGDVIEAKAHCLEALKLATKLQTLSQCAELLVVKAELELMKGEREECGHDLEKVRNLLELCTDFSNREQKAEVKIKPRKGCPAKKAPPPVPGVEEDGKDFLSTRWFPKEPAVVAQANSPPLKARPQRWLSSLAHEADCRCPCCSEPSLGWVTACWAATQADLALQLGPAEARVSRKLFQVTLSRCKTVTAKLSAKLDKLFPLHGGTTTKRSSKPTLMQDVVGRVYLRLARSGLEARCDKVQGIWSVLDAGLALRSPELRPLRASLLVTKAVASLLALAAQKDCTPEELFSAAWTWNAPKGPVEVVSQPKTLPPSAVLKKTKGPVVVTVKDPAVPAKTKDPAVPAKTKEVKVVPPKIKVPSSSSTGSSSSKGKALFPMTPVSLFPMTPIAKSAKEFSCFDFDAEVPSVACTPVQRVRAPPQAQKARATPRIQFQVFEETSPPQEKANPVPAAPKRTKKSRFKVDFSDESDPEADPKAELKAKREVSKKRAPATRTAQKPKAAPEPPAEKVPPKRPARPKKSTALARSTTSSDEEVAPVRRGRTRRAPSGTGEAPERLRSIEEEVEGILDMSIEQLRASDTEAEEGVASNGDFEVLRRDLCGDLERVGLSEIRSQRNPGAGLQVHLSHAHTGPESLSVEAVEALLRSSFLALQHFPPPGLYSSLCALLALSLGQRDPVTTAMLHTQALGATSRHHTMRHLASRLNKLKKSAGELADRMSSLSLDEPTTPLEQRLSRLERTFSFSTADPSSFPQHHCQEFIQQVQHIPSGVTVCVLSVVALKPGEIGDTVLLSRLQRDSAPITVHIPTAHRQHPVSWLVQEMDSVQAEQKVVSCVSDKAKWWEGRRALDSRVGCLLEEMEGLLGPWRGLLLPLTADPELAVQVERLRGSLSTAGVHASQEMLTTVLSASPLLSQADLQLLARGLSPGGWEACRDLLQRATSRLAGRAEPQGHLVLILDKYLQKLPWESVSCLKQSSVSRMPSLHSLLGHCIQRSDPQSVLSQGVDTKQVFYVLNPDANLGGTEERFKQWFSSEPDWQGVCGAAPNSDDLQDAVATKDLYIYVGHGVGARFLDGRRILKQEVRAASLLFGCSSAALPVRGELEGSGIVLHYLMAGCPLFLGNLWDVTDRDHDRFTKALLESWLSAGPGAPLLDHMGPSRLATHLKHLVGAAPVVYGLPIHLR